MPDLTLDEYKNEDNETLRANLRKEARDLYGDTKEKEPYQGKNNTRTDLFRGIGKRVSS